jgi:hypothetical protein
MRDMAGFHHFVGFHSCRYYDATGNRNRSLGNVAAGGFGREIDELDFE